MRRLFLVLVFTSSAFGQVTYLRLESNVIQQKLKAPHDTAQARFASLTRLFQQAGCKGPMLQAQDVSGEKSRNLICTLRGSGLNKVVIGAPLDYDAKGDEAAVQWATVALLPLLAESLDSVVHKETFVLAAFAGKEGIAGAKTYVSSLTADERRSIEAVISLDHLGRTPAGFAVPAEKDYGRVESFGFIESFTQRSLLTDVLEVAADKLQIAPPPLKLSALGRGFLSQFDPKTLLITIHSPAYTSMEKFGGTKMRLARTALDQKQYERTYNLMSVYGLLLDQALNKEKRPDSAKSAHSQATQ